MRESEAAVRAWQDYLLMPESERSLDALAARYQHAENPPTRFRATLMDWSRKHSWQARLAGLVAREREDAEARVQAERRHVFEQGLGLDYQRVTVWKQVADKAFTALERADFGTHAVTVTRHDGSTRTVLEPNTPPRYIEVQAHLLETALSQIRAEQQGGVQSPDTLILIQNVYQTARESGLTPQEILDELSPELQARLRPAFLENPYTEH
jgi:hypothetical protein